jgi:hypothetical protein
MDAAWNVATALGAAMAVVGWTDLVLLWWQPHFGNLPWEFGTIGAHFAGMPLPTIGLALVSVGAMTRGWRRILRVLAVLSVLFALLAIVLGVLYVLDVFPAWRAVTGAGRPALVKAVVKTGVFGVVYTAMYAYFGRLLWRSAN